MVIHQRTERHAKHRTFSCSEEEEPLFSNVDETVSSGTEVSGAINGTVGSEVARVKSVKGKKGAGKPREKGTNCHNCENSVAIRCGGTGEGEC